MANVYRDLLDLYNNGDIQRLGELLKIYAQDELEKEVSKAGSMTQSLGVINSIMKQWAKSRHLNVEDVGVIECNIDGKQMYAALTEHRVVASTFDFGKRHVVKGDHDYFDMRVVLAEDGFTRIAVGDEFKAFMTENKNMAKQKLPVGIHFIKSDKYIWLNVNYMLDAIKFSRSNDLEISVNMSRVSRVVGSKSLMTKNLNTPIHIISDNTHSIVLPINPGENTDALPILEINA